MRGYRIWPAMLVALLGAGGAAAAIVAESTPAVSGCADGLEWAAISVLPGSAADEAVVLAGYQQEFGPVLAGCLDVQQLQPLDPADIPDPRS